MIAAQWAIAGATLGILGSLYYAATTLTARSRPNVVTWSIWAAAPLIGFFAQLDDGVGWPALQTLSAGVGPLIVVIAATVSRHGFARVQRWDPMCAAIAVLALIAWLVAGHASLAVLLAVAADAAAAVPTVTKAWRNPESENVWFYVAVAVGSAITLLTITTWEPSSWVFAAYILVLTLTLTAIIAVRRTGRPQP